MTIDEALNHIEQVFEAVDEGDRIILLHRLIEDQADSHYLERTVFLRDMRHRIELMVHGSNVE